MVIFLNYQNVLTKDEFRRRARALWKMYLEYAVPSDYVVRSGYHLCDVYEKPSLMEVRRKFQSDTEHMYSTLWWANELSYAFPELSGFREHKSKIMDMLLTHDLFECKLGGDIPDTSDRNNEDKDAKEAKIAEVYFSMRPNPASAMLGAERFSAFQEKYDVAGQIAYCVDKTDAIMRGLAYEVYGQCGTVGGRGFRSDDEEIAITGTNLLVDCWLYGCALKMMKYPCGDFFVRLTEETIRFVRGQEVTWINKVPEYQSWNVKNITT